MHTVNKAYKLLVEEGVLVQQKKGFMVNPTMKIKMQEKELALYRERLEELIIDTHIFSISEEEIEKMRKSIEKMLKESEQI